MTSTRSRVVSRTSAERLDHRLEVLPLVVRREAEDGARHRRIIAGWPRRCPGTRELADQLDLLADLSEILEEESFKVIAYRRAAARIRESAVPIAELALEGKAKELPGIGKTIEQKVVEVVEDGEMHALTRRRGRVPAGVVDFLRLPGVGPKTAARIWTQLGITTLDGLQGRCGGRPAARALGDGGAQRGEDPEGARGGRRRAGRGAAAPRHGACRPCGGSSPSSRLIRPRSPSRRRAASGAGARPCATSTSSRRRAMRRRSSRRSATGAGSPRSSRAATRRRRSSGTTPFASTFASCRPSATATSSSTSPARRTTTSRCARRRSGAGSRSPSTA